jgi:hypothetical protein
LIEKPGESPAYTPWLGSCQILVVYSGFRIKN